MANAIYPKYKEALLNENKVLADIAHITDKNLVMDFGEQNGVHLLFPIFILDQ